MRDSTTVTRTLAAPAQEIWDQIAGIGGVDRWLPMITSCRVDGAGAGARRVCTTEHGEIIERVEAIDHATRTFVYTISEQPILPVTSYRGTMRVGARPDGAAEVTWTAEYEVAPEARATVRSALDDVFATGLAGLEQLSRSPV